MKTSKNEMVIVGGSGVTFSLEDLEHATKKSNYHDESDTYLKT